MSKQKEPVDILEGGSYATQDLEIFIGDKVLFFGRLSDITRLPDWFKEDEDKDAKRHDEKWDGFLGLFRHNKIDIFHSQWYKVLFATDEKTKLYNNETLAVISSLCVSGFGKLVLIDGYPKETLEAFGKSVGLTIQVKKEISGLVLEDKYIPVVGSGLDSFIRFPTKIIYINHVETRQEIDGYRENVRTGCKDYKTHLVDLTDPDWLKKRLPSYAAYFEARTMLEQKLAVEYGRGYTPPSEGGPPLSSGGGGLVLN